VTVDGRSTVGRSTVRRSVDRRSVGDGSGRATQTAHDGDPY
jgi:hypothetical protein